MTHVPYSYVLHALWGYVERSDKPFALFQPLISRPTIVALPNKFDWSVIIFLTAMWTLIVSSCTFQTLVRAIVLCDLQVQSFKGVN